MQFYRDQLGFNLAFDARLQSGERWVAVSPPDGSAVLTLIAPPRDSEEYKLIGRPTPVVFVTEDVAAKYQEWRKRGVRFRHTPRLRRVTYERQKPAPASLTASSSIPWASGSDLASSSKSEYQRGRDSARAAAASSSDMAAHALWSV